MPLDFDDIRQCYHILQQQSESLSEAEFQKINQLKNATTEFSVLISERIKFQEARLDAAQLDELNKWNLELAILRDNLTNKIHALSIKTLLSSNVENEEKSPPESSIVDSLLEFSRDHPEIAQTLTHVIIEQFKLISGESIKKKKEFISHCSRAILRNIRDQKHAQDILTEFAKQVAILDPKKFPQYIQEFNITRNDSLIEIAKISAEQSGKATAKFFHKFGIKCETPQDFASIKEIILVCYQRDYEAVAKHIKNFAIDSKTEEGQTFLIKLAQNLFEMDSILFLDIIRDFEIDAERPEGHHALVEMAKRIASKPFGIVVAANFQKLGFKKGDEQETIIQLAKDISKNSGEIAKYLPYFQIDPSKQQDLIEIAMNTIRNVGNSQDDESALRAFENFEIDFHSPAGKDALIKIAKEAIKKNAAATIENLHQFHLDIHTKEGKQAIVQIIKEGLLSNQSYHVIKNINRLGFDPANEEDQNILFDLAKFAARHCWESFCYFPDKFNIASENHRQILLDLALAINPSAINYYDDFNLSKKNEIEELFALTERENLAKEDIERCFFLLQSIAEKNHFDIGPLIQSIREMEKKAKNEAQVLGLQKNLLQRLAFMLHRLNIEGANVEKIKPEIQRILNLRSPQLREICGNRLIENLSNRSTQNYFESLRESANVAHCMIPNICLATLFQQGVSKAVIEECANEVKMLKRDKSQHPLFREATINKLLLRTLNALIEDKQLSSSEKELLLKNLFKNVESYADVKNRLNSLLSLLSLSRADLIKNILASNKKIPPKEIFEQIEKGLSDSVQALLPIKTEAIKDFSSKWSNFYQYLRSPTDLFIYAASLSRLPSEDRDEIMPYLGKFIETSLEGTFKKARYSGSVHLDLLKNQLGEERWKIWQEGESSSLETFLSQATTETKKAEEKKQPVMTAEERLKQALKSNMKETEYPILFEYLKNSTDQVLDQANQRLNEQLQKAAQDLKATKDPQETARLKNIQRTAMIQRRALQFLNPTKKEDPVKILNDLLPFFDEQNPVNKLSENDKKFQKEILAIVQALESPEEAGPLDENVGDIITDTDDGCDALESGTEIKGGSCQGVGQDARLNRGLLSFILDGKNRMIAIKKPSGVIETRAFIRLLLDENKQPVLFLERIYPMFCLEEHQKAIIKMAKKRAAALGVPLLSVEVQTGEPYPHPIKSLGSNVPYDYVDANSMGLKKTYTINNACFVT
jgi:hypothetical protein